MRHPLRRPPAGEGGRVAVRARGRPVAPLAMALVVYAGDLAPPWGPSYSDLQQVARQGIGKNFNLVSVVNALEGNLAEINLRLRPHTRE